MSVDNILTYILYNIIFRQKGIIYKLKPKKNYLQRKNNIGYFLLLI